MATEMEHSVYGLQAPPDTAAHGLLVPYRQAGRHHTGACLNTLLSRVSDAVQRGSAYGAGGLSQQAAHTLMQRQHDSPYAASSSGARPSVYATGMARQYGTLGDPGLAAFTDTPSFVTYDEYLGLPHLASGSRQHTLGGHVAAAALPASVMGVQLHQWPGTGTAQTFSLRPPHEVAANVAAGAAAATHAHAQ